MLAGDLHMQDSSVCYGSGAQWFEGTLQTLDNCSLQITRQKYDQGDK